MAITVTGNALELARANGFLEAKFAFGDDDPGSPPGAQEAVSQWEDECRVGRRHVVLVGELPADYFVIVILRDTPPEKAYVLDELAEVFRRRLGCEPDVDVEEGPVVWTSPKISRETAITVAQELIIIDLQERDDDLETAFRVMTS